MSNKLPSNRGNGPDDPEGWERIWNAVEKAEKIWTYGGGGAIVAIVSNWKALIVILAVLGLFNSPEIADLVRRAMGAIK